MSEARRRGTRGALELAAATGEPRIVVVPTAADLAAYAAHEIGEAVGAAIRERGVAHVALTGGSTAAGVYRALLAADRLHVTPWHRAHLWWGDDRYVPRGSVDSNALVAEAELLGGRDGAPGLAIPRANVHPIPTDETLAAGGDPEACALAYCGELGGHLPVSADGWPVFDLVLLGIGSDGHCLSVFPESPAFASDDWAVGVPAPTHIGPHLPRVTLNPAIVPTARAILALATGEGKAEVLGALLGSARDVLRLPAQLARRPGATWVLDEDAARKLPTIAKERPR